MAPHLVSSMALSDIQAHLPWAGWACCSVGWPLAASCLLALQNQTKTRPTPRWALQLLSRIRQRRRQRQGGSPESRQRRCQRQGGHCTTLHWGSRTGGRAWGGMALGLRTGIQASRAALHSIRYGMYGAWIPLSLVLGERLICGYPLSGPIRYHMYSASFPGTGREVVWEIHFGADTIPYIQYPSPWYWARGHGV